MKCFSWDSIYSDKTIILKEMLSSEYFKFDNHYLQKILSNSLTIDLIMYPRYRPILNSGKYLVLKDSDKRLCT